MTKIKSIQDLSIKHKIITIILSVTVFFIGLGFIFIAIWNINRIKTDIQNNLILNAKLVGEYCVVPLTFGDRQQATETLSQLKKIDFIETGMLYDKEGNIFAMYPDTLNENSSLQLQEQQDNIFTDGYFYVKEPVLYQNNVYGTFCIKANSKTLTAEKRNMTLTLSLLYLVLISLSFITAGRIQQIISIPIENLKNYLIRIGISQDLSSNIPKQYNDEIGDLYDEFNSLINQIQNRSDERDRAEKQLRESQEKLDLALQGGDIGIWESDLKTHRITWDTKMEKMFGLEEGSFNQTFEAYIGCLHPDDIVPTEKAKQDAFNDIAPYDIIYRVVWKNKKIKFIRAKALIARDEEQNPVKMVGVCFDVTEIKEAEVELKRHRESLEILVNERTKKLETKNEELERFNQLFVDREFRIKELKEELESLKSDKEN